MILEYKHKTMQVETICRLCKQLFLKITKNKQNIESARGNPEANYDATLCNEHTILYLI